MRRVGDSRDETDDEGNESGFVPRYRTALENWKTVLKNYRDVTRESITTNHIHREDVQSYAKSVTKFLQASEANCKVGDQFGIGTLCKVGDQLAKSVDAAHKLLGICDFDSTEAQSAAAARSAFGALSDTDRLVTFSGTAAVELEWAIGVSTARTSDVGYTSDASTSYGVSQSVCADILRKRMLGASGRRLEGDYSGQGSDETEHRLSRESKFGAMADAPGFCRRLTEARRSESPLSEADCQMTRRLGVGINADFSQTWGSSLSVELSRSAARSQTHGQVVAVTLGDPSPYDFFAVKITQDPVHGTPIFTTMGGQSSCPGETATTKIDSRITINALEYHCGDSFKPRADCDDLKVGEIATIGVILQSTSPSMRPVLYRLDIQQVSPWNAGKYYGGEAGYCGAAGDSSGLDIKINRQKPSAYMLDGLPYGQSEVLLTVTRTHPSCYEFNDIAIKLTSQCEYDADDVYQYRTTLNADNGEVTVVHPVYDDANIKWGLADGEETAALNADGSNESFSVAWQRARPMTTPEPSTHLPTRAPTEAALSISIAVVAAVSANATQSSYCAHLVSSGMVDVQAKVVEGYVVPGRRLMVAAWAAALLEASSLPARAPRTYAAAPSDDDDDDNDAAATSPAVLAILVLVSILVALNSVVAAVLLAPHCGGGGARLARLSAGLKSFKRRKKEHRDDPKIDVGGGDTEMADRAPPSPLHR
ncbi:hypothetical protein M885DRAFT_574079 [Pelagophyceae sp. CCMP2097]|nr:hypothetical protein M885DRAFT_574079 [Pelagophyceae sp. CCMP2097]